MNQKKVSFVTLGCKVNQYDSDAMRTLFLKRGYRQAGPDEEADVYVVNTCSVTGEGDRKSRQMVRRIRRQHPGALIAVSGCYAQLDPETLVHMGAANVVIGTRHRDHIVDYIEEAAEHRGEVLNKVGGIMQDHSYENLEVEPEGELTTRAFIKVQEGCNNFCTYCVIPYARGPLKSRNQEDAVREARRMVDYGYREIVLTGIHLGNYGRDLHDGTSLATLVGALLRIPDLLRIRLGSVESVELSDDLVKIMSSEPRVCRHLHLPIQSGSEDILRRMHRHYTLQQFKDLIHGLREKIPGLALTTDLIVGFPGETEENFQETLETLKEIRFSDIHVFPYSRRTGTPAASYPNQVPGNVRHERVRRVKELEKPINEAYRKSFLGRTVRVIAEQKKGPYFEGLSDEYIRVSIRDPQIERGKMYDVYVDRLTDTGLEGTIAKED